MNKKKFPLTSCKKFIYSVSKYIKNDENENADRFLKNALRVYNRMLYESSVFLSYSIDVKNPCVVCIFQNSDIPQQIKERGIYCVHFKSHDDALASKYINMFASLYLYDYKALLPDNNKNLCCRFEKFDESLTNLDTLLKQNGLVY